MDSAIAIGQDLGYIVAPKDTFIDVLTIKSDAC